MIYYILYGIFVIIWIIGIYLLFNRKKIVPKNEDKPQPKIDIIATPNEPKIRLIFDQNNPANLDMKSLADLTVKYSDLISGNYVLPKVEEPVKEELTEKKEPDKFENMDLSEYINIFTIKTLKPGKAYSG